MGTRGYTAFRVWLAPINHISRISTSLSRCCLASCRVFLLRCKKGEQYGKPVGFATILDGQLCKRGTLIFHSPQQHLADGLRPAFSHLRRIPFKGPRLRGKHGIPPGHGAVGRLRPRKTRGGWPLPALPSAFFQARPSIALHLGRTSRCNHTAQDNDRWPGHSYPALECVFLWRGSVTSTLCPSAPRGNSCSGRARRNNTRHVPKY